MHKLCSLLLISALPNAFGSEILGRFIEDIIDTWQLLSPTVIVVKSDFPEVCMTRQWLLCLSDGWNAPELAEHLDQRGKQDGIIFLGRKGHEELIHTLQEGGSSLLTRPHPVFMPTSYKTDIELRLDSNVLFFNEQDADNYQLYDIFAAKGGPLITLEVAKWDVGNGMTSQMSLNRWSRRTDLSATTFVNCLCKNPGWTEVKRDKNGKASGSEGYLQDMLFFITDRLNVSVETLEVEWGATLFENGSWSGGMGVLQRKEADVFSSGLAITFERSEFIDYPTATIHTPQTLHAAIPKGISINMWVYLTVFGPLQWACFVALLVLISMGLCIANDLSHEKSVSKFGMKRGGKKDILIKTPASGLALVCLYTMQMGSHANSKSLALRLITLTTSMLTLLLFVYYTNDITANMTAGAPGIPIRTFQDVVDHDYRVVTHSPWLANSLASALPGTPKHTVYHGKLQMTKTQEESLTKVISDSKTLFFWNKNYVGATPELDALVRQTHPLRMDDAIYGQVTLALQKDSEFLQLFNHYILRAYESGFYARLFRYQYADIYTKENFEMTEPQALGYDNIMFCFICLVVGIGLAITAVLVEFVMKEVLGWARSESVIVI